MTDDREQIDREAGIQGTRWHTLHEGYFANAAIAAPLVEAVHRAADAGMPDVIADLGGGTGFVLRRLRAADLAPHTRLVNVDLSSRQLAESADGRIECLRLSAGRVTRRDLNVRDGRLMFVMRSLLHYVGREGLRPLLEHIRAQMIAGEAFVQQTACFAESRDAECMDVLYRRMRTDKWYPTLDELRAEIEGAGWTVREVEHAPPLALTSDALAERYSLRDDEMRAIRADLRDRFGPVAGVFLPKADGFTSWLHYHIITCRR
ncbi:MAG TPA: hypothetical protein VM389_07805 [Phycisphaerae bacterium]|nr:hypothetical protein [Phycisphaerae bacterium]